MEIRESKERADVEEVFRKKGGTKWKKRNWKEASENQRFPDLRGKRRKPVSYTHLDVYKRQGGAWLSSARVVRCWVKSRNERNPYPQ